MLAPPPLATYPSRAALLEAIQSWASARGYAFSTAKSKATGSGFKRVYYGCDRRAQAKSTIARAIDRVRDTQSRGTGCIFSILGVELLTGLGWELRYRPEARFRQHNHLPSSSPAAYPTLRHLSVKTRHFVQQLHDASKSNICSSPYANRSNSRISQAIRE
jgi:hypothetical protein